MQKLYLLFPFVCMSLVYLFGTYTNVLIFSFDYKILPLVSKWD